VLSDDANEPTAADAAGTRRGNRRLRVRTLATLTACLAAVLVFGPPAPGVSYQWEVALPGYRYQFPRDHFNHPGYQTEWWYYTGNLKSAEGRRFGFELTFFRQGIARPVTASASTKRAPSQPARENPVPSSPWTVNDIWMAHLALSDLDGGRFYHAERLNRAGPGLAGADLAARRIWNGNWEVRFDPAPAGAQPAQLLQAVADEFTLHLTLDSRKPPVIHGADGVSQKAPGRGQSSHYISYTRLEAAGQLELAGQSFSLSGLAWMDHEFFSHQLTPEQAGWDWLSIQLASGEELMLYRLRRRDGTLDPYSAGTFVDASGASRHLSAADFSLVPGAAWTSPTTGAHYPVHWTARVPSLALELDASTPLDAQELVSQNPYWPSYWEGAITLRGTRQGHPASGAGYLEMTGYDRAITLPH
jgi:predicted secreted hydrolase